MDKYRRIHLLLDAPSYSPPVLTVINQTKASTTLASTREKWLSQKKKRRKRPLPGGVGRKEEVKAYTT